MPTYALLQRERTRTRGRSIPNAPGNYITSHVFAQVWFLNFDKTDKHYIVSILAKDVYSHAVNSIDNPPPKPAWKLLESSGNAQQVNYPAVVVTPQRVPPQGIPNGVSPVIIVSSRPGGQGVFVPSDQPRQLFATKLAVKRITILADSANAADVWAGYSPFILTDNAFPLAPGSARDFDIDDASQLWLVAENTTDQVFFVYEV